METRKRIAQIQDRFGLSYRRDTDWPALFKFCDENNLVPKSKSYHCLCPLLQPRPHFKKGGWFPECPNNPGYPIWDHVSFFRTPGEEQARCIVSHTYYYDGSESFFQDKEWQAVRTLTDSLGLVMKINPNPKDSWYWPGEAIMIEFWRK